MPRCCSSHRTRLWLILLTTCVSYAKGDILVYSLITDRPQVEEEFHDMPARFGGLIPVDGVKGMVAYAEPSKACHSIKGPPKVPDYDGDWIVLIARFNCSFEIKVRMAEQAGYSAAIIHNVGSEDLEPMSAKDSTGITIPSVFVRESSGLKIQKLYLYSQQYFLVINDDLPFNINTHLLLPFAIVVGICFLVMVIFMVVRCIKDRRRQRRHRLPNSSLKKIPTHKYTKGDPYETCAICLEDYAEGEKLRVLPCAHAYHAKCIDPWLTKNRRVCPVCKRKVFAADERVVTDSESDSDADDTTPLIRDLHGGTQGGTFTPQRENPFSRMARTRQRRDSEHSVSSIDSTRPGLGMSDGESTNNGESSGTGFMVSDSHSINGETPDLERSVNSTKPHTINLSVDGDDQALPEVYTVRRNSRTTRNQGNRDVHENPTSDDSYIA